MFCGYPMRWRLAYRIPKLVIVQPLPSAIRLRLASTTTNNCSVRQFPEDDITNLEDQNRERIDLEIMKSSLGQNMRDKNIISYQKYQYSPLDNSKNSIRLLHLLPAPASWPLRCSIFHTTLEDAPPYIALSYAWGDKSGSQHVLVGSEHLSITPNLKHALNRLRPPAAGESLVLWIDAICIDQENIPERNVQTANMRAIYQHASSVDVWLGLESNRSRAAIQLARDLNACHSRDDVRSLVGDHSRKESFEALVGLFRRQYWWRIWVIQEVSSARHATVYCGDESISWIELDNVCDVLKNAEEQLSNLFYKHPSYIRTLIHGGPRGLQLSRFSPSAASPPLVELLITHKSKKSTDPKDKVYALVGISDARHTFGTIDYSKSMRDIYTHTARHIISTSQKLDVICVKQHDIDQYDLPTWVPDWTRPPSNTGATVIGLHHHEPGFSAAGDSNAQIEFLASGYVLKARGFILDSIKAVGMPYKKHGPPSDVTQVLEVFHDWWNLYVGTFSNSIYSQARFGRAISCGRWDFAQDATYASKLEAIFTLSDEVLADSDMLRLDPPSRSNTSTMTSSVVSLQDEETDMSVDEEERSQLSTAISAGLTMNRRRMFISQLDGIGLAPFSAQQGDLICILLGCRFPIILRPQDGHYIVIGEAYMDGFMCGEAIAAFEHGDYSLETFEIH